MLIKGASGHYRALTGPFGQGPRTPNIWLFKDPQQSLDGTSIDLHFGWWEWGVGLGVWVGCGSGSDRWKWVGWVVRFSSPVKFTKGPIGFSKSQAPGPQRSSITKTNNDTLTIQPPGTDFICIYFMKIHLYTYIHSKSKYAQQHHTLLSIFCTLPGAMHQPWVRNANQVFLWDTYKQHIHNPWKIQMRTASIMMHHLFRQWFITRLVTIHYWTSNGIVYRLPYTSLCRNVLISRCFSVQQIVYRI